MLIYCVLKESIVNQQNIFSVIFIAHILSTFQSSLYLSVSLSKMKSPPVSVKPRLSSWNALNAEILLISTVLRAFLLTLNRQEVTLILGIQKICQNSRV